MAGRGRESADPLIILALAQGMTIVDAAKAAGVSERTVYRRLDDHEFRLEVAWAQQALVTQALGSLAAGWTKELRRSGDS